MKGRTEISIALRSHRCDALLVGTEVAKPIADSFSDLDLPAAVIRRAQTGLGTATLSEVGQRRSGAAAPAVRCVTCLALAEKSDAQEIHQWVRSAIREAERQGARELALAVPSSLVADVESRARFLRAVGQEVYRFDEYRQRPRAQRGLRRVAVVPHRGQRRAWEQTLAAEMPVVRGAWTMRDLANTPPNRATPAWMAGRCKALADELGAGCLILAPPQLRRRGMSGLLAVGSGSPQAPRMVRIEFGKVGPVVALVGKGVTFDTGGISIKPSAGMEDMVYDKSGACLVLGIVRAVAELRLPVRLRAYLPFAENMPDGSAYRPGDILRFANGKTVEINNTDAEGRLILADALTWAAAERPDHIVEFSTLTGACVVALGHHLAGLFTPDDDLATALLEAARSSGEGLWRLPLGASFLAEMKGTHADLKNSGGRWGGASTAAAFLSQFVGNSRSWAHVDIAGPASGGHEAPGPKGSTGYGVGWVVTWLRALSRKA
jgi:leucyl aminopeptidase